MNTAEKLEPSKEVTVQDRAALALLATETEKQLRDLLSASKSIVTVTNKGGREECHAQYMLLKNARVAVEKRGKEVRDDATKFSKAVIAEEKRLIAITEAEEARLQKLRDEFDAEIERQKEELRKAEQARVDGIRERIEDIRNQQSVPPGATADDIKFTLDRIKALEIDDTFAEFQDMASAAKSHVIGVLMLAHNQALQSEKAAAEKAEAERIERERIAAEKAENERVAAELKRQQEEIAAQQAALKAQQEEAERKQREERERLEQERAEMERQRAEIEAAKTPVVEVLDHIEGPDESQRHGDVFPPDIEDAVHPVITKVASDIQSARMSASDRADFDEFRAWLFGSINRAPLVECAEAAAMIAGMCATMRDEIAAIDSILAQ